MLHSIGTVGAAVLALAGGHHHPRTHSTPLVGVGDVPGCIAGINPAPYLHPGAILRVIVNPQTGLAATRCARVAEADGYRVDLDIQWFVPASPRSIKNFFRRVLTAAGPVWAVSVGNEEDLFSVTANAYAATWRAVQPIIATRDPNAIRVAGEETNWSLTWLRHAWSDRLPGAQVVAIHPYPSVGGPPLSVWRQWTRSIHMPLWFTEGLCGPGYWQPGGCFTRQQARTAGATVALEWYG